MASLYKVEYVHMHEGRKKPVHKRTHGWARFEETKKFLQTLTHNPRVYNIRVLERLTREVKIGELLEKEGEDNPYKTPRISEDSD